MARIRSCSRSSTYGPFLTLRPMSRSALLRCRAALPAADNELGARLLLVPRLPSLRLAPGAARRPAARALALAAAQRVIHRIHGHAPHPRVPAQPARLPRLADRLELVVRVPHLAHRG